MDPLRLLRADFQQLEEYLPVRPLDVLAREIGLPVDQLAKLDANENLYGPIPEIREAVAAADLHIYPDPGQGALREAVGAYLAVDPDTVVAGAGADDLIDILIRLVAPAPVVSAPPTFGMYGFLAKIAASPVIEVPRSEGFAVDLAGIEAAVARGARLVFLASPNNPSGNLLANWEVERLCALEALIVVDEAYAEFSGATAIPLLERHPNLVVLRTFSKWAGLAGLRAGYALAHPPLAGAMMATKQPYNLSVAADAAARAALLHRARIFETVACIVAERERLLRELAKFSWLAPLPSRANFVLVRVEGRPARELAAALARQGVIVRYYDRPELSGYIRISAGRPEDTNRLVAALRSLEAP